MIVIELIILIILLTFMLQFFSFFIDRKGNKVTDITNENKLMKKNTVPTNPRNSRRFSCTDISPPLKVDTKSLTISTSGPLSDSISSSGFYGSPGRGTTKNHYNNIHNDNFVYKIDRDHDITQQWSTPLLARNAKLRQLQSEESILKKLSSHKDDTFLVDRLPAESIHDTSVRQFLKKNSINYHKANKNCYDINTNQQNSRNQNGKNYESPKHIGQIEGTYSSMHMQDHNAYSDEEKSSKQKQLQYKKNQLQRGQTEEIGLLLNENFHERQSQQKYQDNNNNNKQQRHNPNHQMQENDRDYLSNNYEEEGQPDKEYLESESEVFAEMEDLWHSQLIGRDQL